MCNTMVYKTNARDRFLSRAETATFRDASRTPTLRRTTMRMKERRDRKHEHGYAREQHEGCLEIPIYVAKITYDERATSCDQIASGKNERVPHVGFVDVLSIVERQRHTKGEGAAETDRATDNGDEGKFRRCERNRNKTQHGECCAERQPTTAIVCLAEPAKDGIGQHECRCEGGENESGHAWR